MRVIIVNERYFVVKGMSEAHDLALKLLNEKRIMGALDSSLEPVVERATAEVDGEFAWSILPHVVGHVQVITPEPVR